MRHPWLHTPLGGDDESVAKIRSVFAIADAFTQAGIDVVLGQSGNIGHTAVALGHVAHYSVGVGLRERVDHAAAISRQKAPDKLIDSEEQGNRCGAVAGIYLPGPAATLGRRAGARLLGNTDIRTRIGCRIGKCGQSVNGPAADPREHYLPARAAEMATMLDKPAPWRATGEIDRLRHAAELRDLINSRYLTAEVRPLKTARCTASSTTSKENAPKLPETAVDQRAPDLTGAAGKHPVGSAGDVLWRHFRRTLECPVLTDGLSVVHDLD